MTGIKKFIFDYIFPLVGRCFVGKNKHVNVIYYHDIVRDEGYSYIRMPLGQFKRQMLYIKENGFETLTFSDLDKYPEKQLFSNKRILITFDDGWLSNYAEIFEWMVEKQLKFNVFLTVGEIGKNPSYLNWDQVKTMQESGYVGFGIHTMTHPDLSRFEEIDPQLELSEANAVLERETGQKSYDFCYPYGKYSQESNSYLIHHTSYKRIFTSDMRFSKEVDGKILFGRNAISADDSIAVFKSKVKGYYNIYSLLKRH